MISNNLKNKDFHPKIKIYLCTALLYLTNFIKNSELAKPLDFVKVDSNKKIGEYIRFPQREELNQEIKETYVVE